MSVVKEKPVLLTWSHQKDDLHKGFDAKSQQILQRHFRIIWQKELLECPDLSKDVHVILGNSVSGTIKLAEDHPEWFPKLQIVMSNSHGYDYVDVNKLTGRGIRVCYTTGYTESTAEFGLLLLLATARNLCSKIEEVKEGRVEVAGSKFNPAPGLTGATLGVIGMGRIGSLVAKSAQCLYMRVLYHNRRPLRDLSLDKGACTEFCPTLDELLRQSDYVILSCPLTPKTRNMIGAEQFKMMKKTAALVNIARAAVIDQDRLVEALESGEIRAAALDVTSPDVLPTDHPLLRLSNVIVTSHCAFCTESSQVNVVRKVVQNITDGLEGKAMQNEVFPSDEPIQ